MDPCSTRKGVWPERGLRSDDGGGGMINTSERWEADDSGMYVLACDRDGRGLYVALEIRDSWLGEKR